MQHYDELQDEAMKNTREGDAATESSDPAQGIQSEPIVHDPNRKLGRAPIIGVVLAALLLGIFVVVGIRSRAHAEEMLSTSSQQNSVLPVGVTTPTQGAGPLEITLPANTQAYIDTPIYARTNGYLRKWYADIATRVNGARLS